MFKFKNIWQVFLYLFEVLGIAIVFTLLSKKVSTISNWYEFVERITIFYALYQMIIIGILSQINDIRKDEYLAITTFYKYLLELSNNEKNLKLKQLLIANAKSDINDDMLNDKDVKKDYEEVINILENNKSINVNTCKLKIIFYEHQQEIENLNWRYSILLRILK